jgi:phosphoserine phosphatase
MSPSRRLLVSIDDQELKVLEKGECIRRFDVSTAAKGMGFEVDSYRTPTGRFRVSERIGDGEPCGTIFKARVPVGLWLPGDVHEGDLILSRILRLDGMDPANENTLERNIYIHGTNQRELLGQPASHGCIRLGTEEMIELFDLVAEGTEVEIQPATRRQGKLLFIDCDSTLSTIEGIDELAHARGEEVFARVVALTHAAMNGEVPLTEVFPRRMEMIRPDYEVCEKVKNLYMETVVPGVGDFVREIKQAGWLPIIVSGGFAPLIKPLARQLDIVHVEAVPLYLNEDGTYKGYGEDYPTTRNLGKNEVIRGWKSAMLPERVVMIGDGISDMETKPDVDVFIGFGGVVSRPKVKEGCDYWCMDMNEWPSLLAVMAGD